MAGKASNLIVRLATAAIGVPVILALLYIAPPWAFYLLVIAVTLVGASELFAMTHGDDRMSRLLGVLLTLAVSSAIFLRGGDLRVILTIVIVVPVLGPLFTLIRLGDIQTAAVRAFAMGFGPLFLGVPLTLLALFRVQFGIFGAGYILLSLGFAWLSDTGGYFAGRAFGKHKLYEAVSPKKTVEGAIGGLVAVVLWAILGHFWFAKSIGLAHVIVLAIVAGFLGQMGDLGESLIKRSTGIKDSGHILPGHGGILDRVDALLVTSAIVYLDTLWLPRW